MTVIGYARVSTKDQDLDGQVDQLTAAGSDRVYREHVSGIARSRPELVKALDYLRAGDTLAVTRLDRLGRSVKELHQISEQLHDCEVALVVLSQGIDTSTPGGRLFFTMLAAIAEFEHDLVVERTKDGLAAARARGRRGGRRPRLSAVQSKQVQTMYDSRDYTVQQIADAFKVSRQTVYRTITTR